MRTEQEILSELIGAHDGTKLTDEVLAEYARTARTLASLGEKAPPVKPAPPPSASLEDRKEQARRDLAALPPLGSGYPEHQRIKRVAEREKLANVICDNNSSNWWSAKKPGGGEAA